MPRADGNRIHQEHVNGNPVGVNTGIANTGSIVNTGTITAVQYLFSENVDLLERCVDELTREGNGNFLWAHYQKEALIHMTWEEDVIARLSDLPPSDDMNKYYDTCVQKFQSMRSGEVSSRVAQRTLALLTYTSGSIPKEVLLLAVTLNTKDGSPGQGYSKLSQDPREVISNCDHLIDFDENLAVFRFYHVSAYQYFQEFKSMEAKCLVAQLCLAHLCSPKFSKVAADDAKWYNYGNLGIFMSNNPFLEFASLNWADSLKQIASLDRNGEENTVPDYNIGTQECHDILPFLENLLGETALPKGVCQIHIVSYFGLYSYFNLCKETPMLPGGQKDEEGSAAIHWAIRGRAEISNKAGTMKRSGENNIAPILVNWIESLGKDALNALDNKNRTPLHHAAYYGDLKMVKLLIKREADLDLQSKSGETALMVACKLHHHKPTPYESVYHDIVLQLVAAKADVKLESTWGTALQAICSTGCVECTKAITSKYVGNIKENCGTFGTSLHSAAFHGHAEIVEHLLGLRKFNVHAVDKVYGSVLTAAAAGCNFATNFDSYEKIFSTFIREKVDVNDRYGKYGPALRAAAAYGNKNLVTKLLENGAKVKLASGPMGTAYEAADAADQEEIKNLLKENDPNADTYHQANARSVLDPLHFFRQEFFRHVLAAGNLTAAYRLINQFVVFYKEAIEKRKMKFLKMMAKLGHVVFTDVIKLATKKGIKNNKKVATHGQRRLEAGEEDVGREGLAVEQELSTVPEGSPMAGREGPAATQGQATAGDSPKREVLPFTNSTEQTTRTISSQHSSANFSQTFPPEADYLIDNNYSKVLDRLTQAAVEILEYAIVNSNDHDVIQLISDEWVAALDTLVKDTGFGKSMLKKVVDNRLRKAKDLAQVGVELLLTTARGGPNLKHLSFELSYLWAQAIDNVLDIGSAGREQVFKLVQFFADKIKAPVEAGDVIEATVIGRAGVEILRSAALSPKRLLMDTLAEEWVKRWGEVIKANMEAVTKKLMAERWEEYQDCIKKGRYNEAIGLAVAGLELLRTAIREKINDVVNSLQPIIIETIEWKPSHDTNQERSGSVEYRPQQLPNLENLFDAILGLIEAAKTNKPSSLVPLSRAILNRMSTLDSKSRDGITAIVSQRVKAIKNKFDRNDQGYKLQLDLMSPSMRYLLKMASQLKIELDTAFLKQLRDSIGSLPGVAVDQDDTPLTEEANYFPRQGGELAGIEDHESSDNPEEKSADGPGDFEEKTSEKPEEKGFNEPDEPKRQSSDEPEKEPSDKPEREVFDELERASSDELGRQSPDRPERGPSDERERESSDELESSDRPEREPSRESEMEFSDEPEEKIPEVKGKN
ncbi:hypothetical protein TrVFT333_000921 [Trichoderma virens FT-333]|nr:hypothetical protein TrVFT333_000921 [Trichoderma virens FT-333]